MSNKTSAPVRSPSYPKWSLPKAIEAVGKIESVYRSTPIDRLAAVKLIGFAALSGPASAALASMAAYGLLERAGKGETRVSGRAQAILHPDSDQERAENLQAAAWEPRLFRNLRDRFEGIAVPPEDGIVNYLNRNNFNPNAVRLAARSYLETARMVESLEEMESSDLDHSERERFTSSDSEQAVVTIEPHTETHGSDAPSAYGVLLPSADGEIEWMRNRVGRSTNVRLMVTGDMGPREIGRLIRLLETQREVLMDESDEAHDEEYS